MLLSISFCGTFLDHWTVGGGLPPALHSKVTVPPFLAVVCPLGGKICILGGTETDKRKSRHFVYLHPEI